jgi:hypothetical protein
LRAAGGGCILIRVSESEETMSEYLEAWQCIGCGRLEAAQNCIGICEDRKVALVHASEHELVLAELASTRERLDALSDFARRLAWTTPRAGEWEHSYRALQQEARRLLAAERAPRGPR